MDLRTSGSRDERRRRVLIDDAQAEPAQREETPPHKRTRSKSDDGAPKVARYSAASLDSGQPRIADLLPQRKLTVWLWFVVAAIIISGLVALDIARADWQIGQPQVDWSIFDLAAPDSLGCWLATLTLGWASFAAVQIYLIRRHRIDDYGGRYRLWAWAAALLLLGCADAATSLHALLGQVLAGALAHPEYARPIGIGVVGLAAFGFALRMVWELKPSRGALALLVLAMLSYTVSGLATLEALPIAAIRPAMLAATAALCGHAFVLLTVGVFGRYVFLEAHGRLPVRVRKVKTTPADADPKKRSTKGKPAAGADDSSSEGKKRTENSNEAARTEPSSVAKRESPTKTAAEKRPVLQVKKPVEAAATQASRPAKASLPADDDFEDDADGKPKLSKAERRKLRKQQSGRQAA